MPPVMLVGDVFLALRARRWCEDPKLIRRKTTTYVITIDSKDGQTYGRTDGRTSYDGNAALCTAKAPDDPTARTAKTLLWVWEYSVLLGCKTYSVYHRLSYCSLHTRGSKFYQMHIITRKCVGSLVNVWHAISQQPPEIQDGFKNHSRKHITVVTLVVTWLMTSRDPKQLMPSLQNLWGFISRQFLHLYHVSLIAVVKKKKKKKNILISNYLAQTV